MYNASVSDEEMVLVVSIHKEHSPHFPSPDWYLSTGTDHGRHDYDRIGTGMLTCVAVKDDYRSKACHTRAALIYELILISPTSSNSR